MNNLALDIETELIAAGRVAPRVACVSMATTPDQPTLHTPDDAIKLLQDWILAGDGWLCGHNIAFDLLALLRHDPTLTPLIWSLYDQGRVWDTGLHERLYTLGMGWSSHPAIMRPIVTGGVSLADLARGLVGIEYGDLKHGDDSPRMQYGDLMGVDIAQWPQSAIDYALLDARVTLSVALHQMERVADVSWSTPVNRGFGRCWELPSQDIQTRAAWALHHLSAWGLRADVQRVEEWTGKIESERRQLAEDLITTGLLRADGKRDLKAIRASVELAYGASTPRTEKGAIQTSGEVLIESGDPDLIKLARYLDLDKMRGTFGPTLHEAVSATLCPRWNTLVRSGRTSCTHPNLQQLPREGGVRECFSPRDGYIYVGADYSTAELVALAHVCEEWGFKSEMASAIRAGADLHLALAAELLNISYSEAHQRYSEGDAEIKKYRSLAKVPNFGLSGGLGPEGLQGFAKSGYGIELTIEECRDLKKAWLSRWPEMSSYFRRIEQAEQRGFIVQSYSQRRRGGIGYTDGANTMFQGLIADGAKMALYDVVRASWAEPESPLFGSRPVLFIHDEIIIETPEEKASAAGDELARLMVAAMKPCIPRLPMGCEPWISKKWSKSNTEKRDEEGRLIPC